MTFRASDGRIPGEHYTASTYAGNPEGGRVHIESHTRRLMEGIGALLRAAATEPVVTVTEIPLPDVDDDPANRWAKPGYY